MRIFIAATVLSIILLPSTAFAWGPLTHIYLGNQLLSLAGLLPVGLYEILKRYKKDFLYGTLMADIIVGKKYMPHTNNSHSWDVAFELFSAARTKQQKAFVYGYMSHLAADTVAHNIYTVKKRNIGHTLLELKADCIIDKKYWLQARGIDRTIQHRNDYFLEHSLDRFIFSFKTNKKILNGMVFLSVFNRERLGDFIDRNLATSLPARGFIEQLHQESLGKITDLFQKWETSEVLKENPNGIPYRGRLMKREMVTFLLHSYKGRGYGRRRRY